MAMPDVIFRVAEQESVRVKKLNQLSAMGGGGGGVWVLADAGGGAVELRELAVQASAPSSPNVGDLWVDIS